MARIAKALATLREQVNEIYPNRSKANDGWIGDAAHAARKSDHNPNAADVVCALDITHDPARGCDAGKLAEALVASRDPRIKYVIFNRLIACSYSVDGKPAWTWRPYSGTNPHDKHVHVSVAEEAARYDDAARWAIAPAAPAVAKAPATPEPAAQVERRRRMAQAILSYEARRDAKGRLAIYRAGDGSREIAGVSETHHPTEFRKLSRLIEAGLHAETERAVADYALAYTALAAGWTSDPGVEFYLRDCVFNRGPTGAVRVLQRALGVEDDGRFGPATQAALRSARPAELLGKLRIARENYEREVVGYRPALWSGLVSRWDKALRQARAFQAEHDKRAGGGALAAGTAAAGGAAAAGAAHTGVEPAKVVALLALALLLAGLVWLAWRRAPWLRAHAKALWAALGVAAAGALAWATDLFALLKTQLGVAWPWP